MTKAFPTTASIGMKPTLPCDGILHAQAEARVERVRTVVAHHEQRPVGHRHRAEPLGPLRRLVEVRLVELVPVHVDEAVPHVDLVAGQTDHPLDVVGVVGLLDADLLREPVEGSPDDAAVDVLAVRRVGLLEHDDVAALGLAAEVIGDLRDEDTVVLQQGRLHRLARDEERLDDEGLDQDGQHQGHQDQPRQLAEEPQDRVALRRSAGRVVLGGRRRRSLFGLHLPRVSGSGASTLTCTSTALQEA